MKKLNNFLKIKNQYKYKKKSIFLTIILLFYLLKEYGYYWNIQKYVGFFFFFFFLHFGSLMVTLLLFEHYGLYCKCLII
jgi:hypothetical protein